jgi:hypothetical protein
MFRWLKARVVKWVEQYQQRQIDALLTESRSLKAQLLELNGGKPIQLSPEQRARLAAKRKRIAPERLKELSVLPIEDEDTSDLHG